MQNGDYDGQEVELKGWVKRTRGSNKIRFVVLRDSTGSIQCVAKRDTVGDDAFEAVASALIESSLIIKGTVIVDERSEGPCRQGACAPLSLLKELHSWMWA